MMEVREKLVELSDIQVLQREIECVKRKSATNCTDCLNCDLLMTDERILTAYKNAIDALKNANGVTVQECGHWVSYQSDEPYGCQDEKEWYRCSKCEKDTYGRCYEDKWYSAPILSAYCPHCGAKMMPYPPKGE